ncbi:MAG: hypothetical protein WBE76_01300 [Terracidiphilus sp.]
MKTNRKREFIAPVAGHGRVLAAFLAIALSASAMGRAQSKPAQPEPATAQAEPAAPAGQPPASESQPKGSHDGIQVHGYWTIEIRDPDGKLVTHREFENALLSNGSTVLGNLLAGSGTSGGWQIGLCHSGGQNNCGTKANPPGTVPRMTEIGTAVGSSSDCTTKDLCYGTLRVTLPPSSGAQTVSLTGSVTSFPLGTATSPYVIDTVDTEVGLCISALPSVNSPSACAANDFKTLVGSSLTYYFTGKSLKPTISVKPGQSVSATVTFSFGSGT